MKKLLLVFCYVFVIGTVLMAQITITQSNMPSVGNAAIERSDTVHAGTSIGNSGTNQTWNFSNWVYHTQTYSNFVSPGSLPGASNFATANAGIDDGSGKSQFANLSSTSLDVLGMYGDLIGTGSNIVLKMNPGVRIISLPSTYNTAYNGTYTYQIQIPYPQPPVDSVKIVASVAYTSLIDAWGTITTPSLSGITSIRQNYREINTSTTYLHSIAGWVPSGAPTVDTTFSYRWWSNSNHYPIAEVQKDNAGTITSVKWLYSYQAGTVSISEKNQVTKEIKVYPNPAIDIIKISGLSEVSAIIISDITGKVIESSILDNVNSSLNISKLNNGIYIYQVTDTKGYILFKGRFVVAK